MEMIMHIGVIGAGWLGGTVGRQWVKAGRGICSTRATRPSTKTCGATAGPPAPPPARSNSGAIRRGVLIAVPYGALPDLAAHGLEPASPARSCSTPAIPIADPESFRKAIEDEGVALATARLLKGARVVRAFSAVDATTVEASGQTGMKLGVPIASDDREALFLAEQLVRDAGCEPVVAGGLADARGFQRGGPGFRANTDAEDLRRRLGLSLART